MRATSDPTAGRTRSVSVGQGEIDPLLTESTEVHGDELLPTPAVYYTVLADRVRPERHSVEQRQDLDILVDEDAH